MISTYPSLPAPLHRLFARLPDRLCFDFALFFLPFAFFGFFGFHLGFARRRRGPGRRPRSTFPTPVNVRLAGVESFGGLGGVEQASASHSVGRGAGGGKPPPTRTS